MPWNLFSKKNEANSVSYTQSNPERNKLLIIAIVVGVLFVGVPVLITLHNRPDKYTQSATEAARKVTPHAKVRDVKVAGGFAIATVSDPTAESQINAGNVTIFKVNEDGSMTQIASGSSFTPLDLLDLGIPIAIQAELTGTNIDQVTQDLAGACGYNGGDAPGYNGFDGSFDPDGWQIDSGTLDNIKQVLTGMISEKNAALKSDEKVVCVNVSKEKSNATTDMKTYISTFTLELRFITGGGIITTRTFTFSTGPNYYQRYTLDGAELMYTPIQNDL